MVVVVVVVVVVVSLVVVTVLVDATGGTKTALSPFSISCLTDKLVWLGGAKMLKDGHF